MRDTGCGLEIGVMGPWVGEKIVLNLNRNLTLHPLFNDSITIILRRLCLLAA